MDTWILLVFSSFGQKDACKKFIGQHSWTCNAHELNMFVFLNKSILDRIESIKLTDFHERMLTLIKKSPGIKHQYLPKI